MLVDPSHLYDSPPGSPEAQATFAKLDTLAHSPAMVAKAKALSGDDHAVGIWGSKILIPGVKGAGQGDFDHLVGHLYAKGYSLDAATKIAAKHVSKLNWG